MNYIYKVIDRFSDSELFQKAIKHKRNINCKFILLKKEYNIVLIIGDLYRHPYHANLLQYYCNTYNIPSGWNKKPDLYEIYESSWIVLGGGWMDLNPTDKSAVIFGQSTVYGKYDSEILNKLFWKSNNLIGYIFSIENR